MYYINKLPNENGNYGNPQSNPFPGSAALPDALLPDYIAARGFADLTVENETVTAVRENTAALATYLAAHPDAADDPATGVSDTELLLELAADHEERICLLELGVN